MLLFEKGVKLWFAMFLIPVTFDGEPFANTCALSPVIQIIVFSLIMLKSVRVCILKQI